MSLQTTRVFHIKLERPGWEYNLCVIAYSGQVRCEYSLARLCMRLQVDTGSSYDNRMIAEFIDRSNGTFLPDVTVTTKEMTGVVVGCPTCGSLSQGPYEVESVVGHGGPRSPAASESPVTL